MLSDDDDIANYFTDDSSDEAGNGGVEEEVETYGDVENEGSMFVGIFWPKDKFEELERSTIPEDQLVSYRHGPSLLKGIFREKCHGCHC